MSKERPAWVTHGEYVEVDGQSVILDHLVIAKSVQRHNPGRGARLMEARVQQRLPISCDAVKYPPLLVELAQQWDGTIRLKNSFVVLRAELGGR